jgi:hypothetical protein
MEEIARDACSKNTQTVETAFVPCEACQGLIEAIKLSMWLLNRDKSLFCSPAHLITEKI